MDYARLWNIYSPVLDFSETILAHNLSMFTVQRIFVDVLTTSQLFKPPRSWGKIYKHIIYAVPTFSNPSFKTMSLRRRQELVRVAREYDALIVTDDVYDFLQWPSDLASQTMSLEKAVLPRIVDIDRCLDGGAEREAADGFGNAVSNGSFSKICGPGLRTGWCEGTAKFAHGVSQT
jgi:DNA-binding transcriptional MocR family regulator